MKSIYETYTHGLQASHRVLTRNLEHFITLATTREKELPSELGDYLRLYDEFLAVHHDSEDKSIFPALHRHTGGRSTDAAHLDRWTSEHRDITRLGRELATLAGTLDRATARAELGARSRDLLVMLQPHVSSEEDILTATHLREMIPEQELAVAVQGIAHTNRSRALPMAGFLANSLEPDEQRAMFENAPWMFRRVLLPISKRRMRRFDAIVHPSGAA